MTLFGQLWYILSPRERRESAILLCAMALGAMFEAVSIGLLVPFIAIVNDPALVLKAPFAGPLLAFLDIHEPRETVIFVGLGLVGVFLVRSGYLVLLYRWLFRYVSEMHIRLTRQLLTGYLNAPYTFHLQRNSAELIKAMTVTVQSFTSGFVVSLLTVLVELVVVAALIILLVTIEPVVTFGAVLVVAVPTALSYRTMRHWLANSGHVAEQSFASVIQSAEQAISGIKETRVTGLAAFFVDRHGYHSRRFADSQRSLMFFSTLPRLFIDTLAVAAMVGIALVVLARGGDVQRFLPVLGLFAVAAVRLIPSMNRIANGLAQLRFRYATAEVIYDELHAIEPDAQLRMHSAPGPEAASPRPFDRALRLEQVSYRFPSAPRIAIKDVSLEIPRGNWVAVVGPTGAGKTTLIDLMLGLYVPCSGRILVDGCDLQDDVAGWQRNIGLVPQDVYLTDDTVRRNVAFGAADQDIDDERVWRALGAAQVDKRVLALPGTLSATIGERGDRLSGGERQRLGIARALYRDPPVLVVDEGTANLDNDTEAAIVDTLAGLRGEKTIIVVAHRLALVKRCDRVYMLKEGQLQNSGTYSDLIAMDPAFRQLTGDGH
jgi:ATP-binding cassette subfamily C protein